MMAKNKNAKLGDHLTPREVQVLACVAKGLSNKRAGAELGISDGAVKFHMINAMAKLGAENRAHAAVKFVLGEYVHGD